MSVKNNINRAINNSNDDEDYMKYLNNGIDFLSKHLEDSSMKDLNRWMKKFAPEISPLRINILN